MVNIRKFVKVSLMAVIALNPHAVSVKAGIPEKHGKNLSKNAASKRTYKGSYEDYFNVLGQRESSGNYKAKNQYGYLGKYQMGEMALIQAGLYSNKNVTAANKWNGEWTKEAQDMLVESQEDFLKNKSAQEYAIRKYTEQNWRMIRSYQLDDYIGKIVQGTLITESGLLAGAHLVGINGLKNFVRKGVDKVDGNGVKVSSYIDRMGGYNTPFILDGHSL